MQVDHSSLMQKTTWTIVLFFLLCVAAVGIAQAKKEDLPPPLTSLVKDGIHDPENPAIGALQNPDESLRNFPKDSRGEVDWVKALEDGLIDPRSSLTNSQGETLSVLDMDVIMEQTADMPHVLFPHKAHTEWLSCDNCHDKIFIPKKNANPVTMDKIFQGEYCGRCHDRVSFSLWVCNRCHNVLHKKSPEKAWWK